MNGLSSPVSLTQLLVAREQRQQQQQVLLKQWQVPLLSVTAVTPGPIKNNTVYQQIMHIAAQAIKQQLAQHRLTVLYSEQHNLITGEEHYYCVSGTADKLKQWMVYLEETHPLGRLWDIDVLDIPRGILSRRQFGYQARRCLLCEQSAHYCARAKQHSVDELYQAITDLLARYDA